MAVETNFASLFENLKLEDPWLPPRTWESIPSESGLSRSTSKSSSSQHLFDTSTVSEASLVRLAMNALHGVQSAIISIEKLSAAFCSDPADRTFHRIPSLWHRSSSTHALGKILKSIGCSGSLVYFLHKFVDYFTKLSSDKKLMGNIHVSSELSENQNHKDSEMREEEYPPHSLINQAFAVAVGKVLEGYICALDTLYASVCLRRSSESVGLPLQASSRVGSLTSVAHSKITLLEVYLHTEELRTQIEALGNICSLHNVLLCSLKSSFEDLTAKSILESCNFPRGGNLLTYLYSQLKVADPAHCALLKFLFLRSCEPYCGFIRSWIYKAEISDPYKEFIVEYADNPQPHSHDKVGISIDFPLASIRERNGVAVPCFLKDFTIPLLRAGQQLQVLMKLLELCNFFATRDHTIEDFLPCWSGFSSNHPSYTSPLTFNKVYIEALVPGRNNYYKWMQKKVEDLFKKIEIRYQQVVPLSSVPIFFDNGGESSNNPVSFTSDGRVIGPTSSIDKRGSNVIVGNVDSEASSTTDSFYYGMDPLDSSESSSLNSSEEQDESEQMIELPDSLVGLEQKYLSALSFSLNTSTDSPLQEPLQNEKSWQMEGDSHETCEGTDAVGRFVYSHHKGKVSSHISVPLDSTEPNWSCMSYDQCADNLSDMACPLGSLSNDGVVPRENRRSHLSDFGVKLSNSSMAVYKEGTSYFSRMITTNNAIIGEGPDKDEVDNGTCSTSNISTLQPWKLEYHSNFLSMNPMLTKKAIFHLMSKPGERCSTELGKSLTCFDFSSVDDPCKVFVEKLDRTTTHGLKSEFPLFKDSIASTTRGKGDYHDKESCGGEDLNLMNACSSFDLKDLNQEDVNLTNVSGGSVWESLLGRSTNTVNCSVGDQRQTLSAMFEIPLDFIIGKCLLQEILLQYKYVSKLTIKLLEEGFDLQEHFLALRRYHFMELADWADLFIKAIWHHKWCVTEADKRVSEIQGFLELSVQRSSCEKDRNKDRLFVYMKGHGTFPLPNSAIDMAGVRSFNFLGLGYRVDWPVSIVLTPGAMEIYAEIFNFLIQVKLALFSLTDIWCSLKDLMHLISQNRHLEQHEQEMRNFNILVKTRHQVNHFVSTLQQYVQSHLSHVSWFGFLHSLKHKVKDMMDLESVHMAYLTDALHICFLSDETRSVAIIIENILQCALDFRSCLTRGIWDAGPDQGDLFSTRFRINLSQVFAIKQTFDKNLKELHLCYLKSPKHGVFGLSHFWEYLNYNEYYWDVGNASVRYAFSI